MTDREIDREREAARDILYVVFHIYDSDNPDLS